MSTTSIRSIPVRQLAEATGDARVIGDGSVLVTGVTYDSRTVTAGDLFAALPGSDFDGHDYIDGAVKRGAVAILAEREVDAGVPVIVVPDSRAALAPLSVRFYGNPGRELSLIGLTGTDGKTTTSYLVHDILRSSGRQTGVIGTVGIEIGDGTRHQLPHQTTPESNLIQRYLREMLDRKTTDAVLEATSHGLHMHRLDGAAFNVAGVTNITHEHLEYHGTIEQYRLAKAILIRRVAAEGGIVVLNADDEGARSMAAYADGATIRWYSMHDPAADLFAADIVADGEGCRFTLHTEGGSRPVSLPALGEFNVANALCAIGVTRAVGVGLPEIVAALGSASGVPGRMTRIDEGQPFSVVVDYAHTPESLDKILALLRRLYPSGRLLVVSGSAGERDRAKRPLQGAVMARRADLTIVTSEDPRNEDPNAIIDEIAGGALGEGAVDGESLYRITDRREAIAIAFRIAQPGDCVLLAGKGHETSMIWGFEHRPWDEIAVAREELRSTRESS